MSYIYLTFYFLFFGVGLIIGSFLNAVIYRIEKRENLMGRSYCPDCKHNLAWFDLIPVFSFLFLGGKCRYCGKKISRQYPLVEISTGLVFLLIFVFKFTRFDFSFLQFLSLIFYFYIASVLTAIFVYDLKHYIIPDKILIPALITTFIYQLFLNFNFLIFSSVWAGLLTFLFFYFIFWVSGGRWMGFGDVKLSILLGLLLGLPDVFLAMFLAFLFGSIIGLGAMFIGKKGLKSQIPFAPFLITGTFIAMLFGSGMIQWYLNLL